MLVTNGYRGTEIGISWVVMNTPAVESVLPDKSLQTP